MDVKELIKPKQKEVTDTPKIRYFETEYTTVNFGKRLLHFNDKGNNACRNWTEQTIVELNTGEAVIWIGHTMEINKSEYDVKMSLPADF